jgi:hypothetical protein
VTNGAPYSLRTGRHSVLAWVRGSLAASIVSLAVPAAAVDLAVPGTEGIQQIAIDSTWSGNTLGTRYADVNVTMSPFGSIYEDGVRFRLSGSWVGYNYLFNTDPRTLAWGDDLAGSFQVGYGLNFERVSAIALIGVAIDENQSAGVRSTGTGFVATLSGAATPTDSTYLYGSASYTTISHSYFGQGKVGLKAFGKSYVGVEGGVSGLLTDTRASLTQRYVGGHITNIPVGKVSFSLSGGYVYDEQLYGGAYITGALYVAF